MFSIKTNGLTPAAIMPRLVIACALILASQSLAAAFCSHGGKKNKRPPPNYGVMPMNPVMINQPGMHPAPYSMGSRYRTIYPPLQPYSPREPFAYRYNHPAW